jgi:hypothetical protein
MYLHIGNGETILKKKIIGMFDLDTASISGVTRDFLKKQETKGNISYHGEDIPRTFVLLEEDDGVGVRLSRISTVGLRARMNTPLGGAEE